MADGSGILDLNNPLSAVFGTVGGTPMSLEEIKRRRAVQAALASRQRGFPKNIGEGLTSLGEAVGDRMSDNRLSAAEAAYTNRVNTNPAMTTVPGAPPGARSDVVDPLVRKDNIAHLLVGGPGGVATPNPTVPGPQTPTTDTLEQPTGGLLSDDPVWSARAGAISGIESGGRYNAVGVPTKYGRALGRYGVVEANVGPWTQAAIGQQLTPAQFLADPKAQDAVFQHRFGDYVTKFGEEGAARAWYGGPGNIRNVNATDAHGRLSVGGYGQDYLRRLQGAQTATSGAPTGGDDAGGVVTDDSGNPPTPTDIKPMVVAQAGGLGTIPGPFDRRVPEPPTPASGLRPADPVANKPIVKPPLPKREEAPTPEELQGLYLLKQFPGDERVRARAEYLIKFGADRRASINAARMSEYEKDMAAYQTKEESERLYAREKPAKDFELQEKRQKAQQAEQDRVDFPLGLDKHHTIVKESYDTVKNVPRALTAINGVKELLASDPGMFTGTGANIQVSLAKVAQKFGMPFDPKASNTETFKGLITPILAALRPAIVGPGSQSQPEFNLLRDAAAGNVSLERRSIENILNAIERQGVLDVRDHQRTVIANAGSSPRGENLRQVWSNSFPLPMERIVPRDIVGKLREEVAKAKASGDPAKVAAELKEFDKAWFTPGLAQQLAGE